MEILVLSNKYRATSFVSYSNENDPFLSSISLHPVRANADIHSFAVIQFGESTVDNDRRQ